MRTPHLSSFPVLTLFGLVAFAACSSEDDTGSPLATGGVFGAGSMTAATGGTTGAGGIASGGTVVGAGGGPSGGTSPGTGGTSPATGGAASGGAASGGAASGGAASGGAASGGGGSTGGTTGTGGVSDFTCTSKPGALRGRSTQTVTVGGVQRSFIYYAPQGLDPNAGTSIVIVAHGYTMSGSSMFDITQYAALADKEKFIVMFPEGIGTTWNIGQGVTCGGGAFVGGSSDDQAFNDAMIAFAEKDQCIDRKHVFITGFSQGAYFSNESACNNPNIAAAAPHSGGTHPLQSCKNAHRPVIVLHFKTDPTNGYQCGVDTKDYWVTHNGCQAANPDVRTVNGGACEYYKGCPADGQVALCSFDAPAGAGAHAWSGGQGTFSSIPSTESATELGWKFFREFAW